MSEKYCSSDLKHFNIATADAPDYLKKFLIYKKVTENRSQNTIYDYYMNLRTFFRWILFMEDSSTPLNKKVISGIPFEKIAAITTDDILEFLSFCQDKLHNTSSKSTACKISALREFYKFYTVTVKRLDINPTEAISSPKMEKRMPKYMQAEDAAHLLKNITGPYAARDYCMILWMLHTGVRVSELVGINNKDVNVKLSQVLIRGKGSVERNVFLNEACIDALEDYILERESYTHKPLDDALFVSSDRGRRLSARRVQQMLNEHLLKVGLGGLKLSPHKLRHTAATTMYREGVDLLEIQALLGHANLATTQIYTHLSSEDLRKTMQRDFYGITKDQSDELPLVPGLHADIPEETDVEPDTSEAPPSLPEAVEKT